MKYDKDSKAIHLKPVSKEIVTSQQLHQRYSKMNRRLLYVFHYFLSGLVLFEASMLSCML